MKPTYYLLLGVAALGRLPAPTASSNSTQATASRRTITTSPTTTSTKVWRPATTSSRPRWATTSTNWPIAATSAANRHDRFRCVDLLFRPSRGELQQRHHERYLERMVQRHLPLQRCARHLEGREELPNYDKYRGEVLFMPGRGDISTFTGLSAAYPLRTKSCPRPMPRPSVAARTTRCTPC